MEKTQIVLFWALPIKSLSLLLTVNNQAWLWDKHCQWHEGSTNLTLWKGSSCIKNLFAPNQNFLTETKETFLIFSRRVPLSNLNFLSFSAGNVPSAQKIRRRLLWHHQLHHCCPELTNTRLHRPTKARNVGWSFILKHGLYVWRNILLLWLWKGRVATGYSSI